ncbi:MAG: DUF3422 family protein [Gammaproteobacteria bacterium]
MWHTSDHPQSQELNNEVHARPPGEIDGSHQITCLAWMTTTEQSLARRIALITGLLSTRVDISRQKQNQALLESMDRRAQTALCLQEMVEGLSIAAISYYVVGLVQHLATGMKATGLAVDPVLVVAGAIPIFVVIVAYATRRVRKRITEDAGHI